MLQTVLACHERGVIHRDIKDENILVNVMEGVPEVQLIDFGSGAHITGETYTDFDGKKRGWNAKLFCLERGRRWVQSMLLKLFDCVGISMLSVDG